MNDNAGANNFSIVPKKRYSQNERPYKTRKYLEILSHYEAELIEVNGPVMVVQCATGAELPFEEKAKLLMIRLLLTEFGTIDKTNQAVKNFKSSGLYGR